MSTEVNGGSKHIDPAVAYKMRHEEHLSDRQIAHRLGVSRVAVWKRLRNYAPPSESPSPAADTGQGSDPAAELERFLTGVAKSGSLKSYLNTGNFPEFKRRIAQYNKNAEWECFSKALETVHGLRREVGWRVLTQSEVEASEEYKRLHFDSERQWVALIVAHQIAESDLTPQQRASGDGRHLYNLPW